jgi:hypothetical protein
LAVTPDSPVLQVQIYVVHCIATSYPQTPRQVHLAQLQTALHALPEKFVSMECALLTALHQWELAFLATI